MINLGETTELLIPFDHYSSAKCPRLKPCPKQFPGLSLDSVHDFHRRDAVKIRNLKQVWPTDAWGVPKILLGPKRYNDLLNNSKELVAFSTVLRLVLRAQKQWQAELLAPPHGQGSGAKLKGAQSSPL